MPLLHARTQSTRSRSRCRSGRRSSTRAARNGSDAVRSCWAPTQRRGQPTNLLVAPTPTCVSRIDVVGADQPQLDVLAVGLRNTAGAVGPAAVQRRARVIVLTREDAD